MNKMDLTTCDKEKIHQITSIQGHGAFVAISSGDLKIHHISENLTAFFDSPEPAKMKIGEKLNAVLPHELFRIISAKLKDQIIYPFNIIWQNLDLYLYQLEDSLIAIEFERLNETTNSDSAEVMKKFLESMKDAKDVAELGLLACRAVRNLTGMSRVMMYRFFPPTMYGEVIAEDRSAGSHSFAGHRFPSTDIPKPARDLYLKNQVRLIQNAYEETSAIYPGLHKQEPLDLSDSRLRAVSLIHIEYLKNMGVKGSFSLAVKVDNKLWGLIACHSEQATSLSHKTRGHCETIANCLALSAPLLERTHEQNKEISFNNLFNKFFVHLKDTLTPYDDLFKKGDELNKIFDTTGFAIVDRKKVNAFGLTPLSADILKLSEWIILQLHSTNKRLIATESLAALDEQWFFIKDQASGILALKLNETDDALLIFFRPEILQTIQWGGDPRKNFEQRNYQGQINPRLSFETWSEIIKYHSKKWLSHEIAGAKVFKDLIFDSLIKKNDLILELGSKLHNKS